MLFVCLALAFVVGLLEVGGAIAWWAATGEMFTWARATSAREQAIAGGSASNASDHKVDEAQRAAAHRVIQHPFLGFVNDRPTTENSALPISPFGFHGGSPIHKRSEDRYVVGILGGSVALQFGLYAEQNLIQALQRSPKLAGRQIEVVNLAIGGYKQPQQLMTLQLMLVLGGEFDCIVNIDGFNEVSLVKHNVPLGVPGWFPRSWARLLDTTPSLEQLRRIGHISVLVEQRQERARSAGSWWWSPLAQFVWRWRDRDLNSQLAKLRLQVESAEPTDNPAVIGPGTNGQTVEQASHDMVDLWQRASRQLHGLCAQQDIRYFHFLQPNQYVPDSKPMGAEELATAFHPDNQWRPFVISGYPKLQAAGSQLRADGIAFTDLTNVFANYSEPLYTDACCHFGPTGNAIVAEHVGAAVRSAIDLAGVKLQRLIIKPESMQLTSPLIGKRLTVTGVDSDGNEYDVSGAGFGTRITAAPAANVHVGANGTISALRRGDATLRVAKDGTTATVELTAAWPDIVEGNDAIAATNNDAPQLRVDPAEVAAGNKTLTIACSNLPKAPMRLVATSPKPLPASPIGAEKFGLTILAIAATGTTATVLAPMSAVAGQPMFVRFYALDATLTKVVAASNTIAITRN